MTAPCATVQGPQSRSMPALVSPISSSYSGCSKLVKELEIQKRH